MRLFAEEVFRELCCHHIHFSRTNSKLDTAIGQQQANSAVYLFFNLQQNVLFSLLTCIHVGKECNVGTCTNTLDSYQWIISVSVCSRFVTSTHIHKQTHTSWCCDTTGGLWARWREDLQRGFHGDRFRGPDLWIRGVQSFRPFGMFSATIMGWNLRLCT